MVVLRRQLGAWNAWLPATRIRRCDPGPRSREPVPMAACQVAALPGDSLTTPVREVWTGRRLVQVVGPGPRRCASHFPLVRLRGRFLLHPLPNCAGMSKRFHQLLLG
jgi:hypothetical protein